MYLRLSLGELQNSTIRCLTICRGKHATTVRVLWIHPECDQLQRERVWICDYWRVWRLWSLLGTSHTLQSSPTDDAVSTTPSSTCTGMTTAQLAKCSLASLLASGYQWLNQCALQGATITYSTSATVPAVTAVATLTNYATVAAFNDTERTRVGYVLLTSPSLFLTVYVRTTVQHTK